MNHKETFENAREVNHKGLNKIIELIEETKENGKPVKKLLNSMKEITRRIISGEDVSNEVNKILNK